MIAITIGTGRYSEMAERSAALVRESCGISTFVAGCDEMHSYGQRIPHFLKFYIFDMTREENILFFDADIVSVNSYDPRNFCDSPKITAIRDVPNSFGYTESSFLGFSPTKYFNTGWFVVNRTHHKHLFDLCKRMGRHLMALWYAGDKHRPALRYPKDVMMYDQAVINHAVAKLGIGVRFLDWRYNYMLFDPDNLGAKIKNIYSMHLISERKQYFPSLANGSRDLERVYEVDEKGFCALAGEWEFQGGGIDRREFALRDDGTIAGLPSVYFWFLNVSGVLILADGFATVMTAYSSDQIIWATRDGSFTFQRL